MKRFDQINVIPFIDIMLVLLAIVLTSATFVAQGSLPITLPKASQSGTPTNSNSQEISIDQQGQIYLNEQTTSLESLNHFLAQQKPDTHFFLRVDAEVRFEKFVAVIDALKQHRLEQVSILTQVD